MDRMKPDLREGKILKDLEEVHNLHCLISEPTRITTTTQTLLDVILTNRPELFRKCGVYNPEISDHCLVYGIMTEKVQQHRPKTITSRTTKITDTEKLNADLADAPWQVGDIFTNTDDQYDYWKGLFESILNKHAPFKKKRVREKDIPYMTDAWKKAIRNKRKYAILFAKDRTPENFELKRRFRNIATKERRKAIKAYWQKTSDELKSKPRNFYKTFRPFLSDKSKDGTNICLKIDEKVEQDQLIVAEVLADYFTTAADDIGGDRVKNLTTSDLKHHNSVNTIQNAQDWTRFEFKPLGMVDVRNALENIKTRKSPGWDAIPPKFSRSLQKA